MLSWFSKPNVDAAIKQVQTGLSALHSAVETEKTNLANVNDNISSETFLTTNSLKALNDEYQKKVDAENTRHTAQVNSLAVLATSSQTAIDRGSKLIATVNGALTDAEKDA